MTAARERRRVRVDVDPVLWARLRVRAEVEGRPVSDVLEGILLEEQRRFLMGVRADAVRT